MNVIWGPKSTMCNVNLGDNSRLYIPRTGYLYTIISTVQNNTILCRFEGNEEKVVRMYVGPLLEGLLFCEPSASSIFKNHGETEALQHSRRKIGCVTCYFQKALR